MTTIVTVHGTFANHEDDAGERWWQQDSPFQQEVTARLDTQAEALEWVPFHWSGQNSEVDRRKGGEALYDFLKENFEDKDKSYYLVGHSHGGSVIAEALRWSTRQKNKLEMMRSWITVATPFLAFRKQKWLFSRVKRRYQLLLTIITAYILAVLLAVPNGMCDKSVNAKGCWVKKSGATYSRLSDSPKILPAFSEKEKSDMLSFGSPVFHSVGSTLVNVIDGNHYAEFENEGGLTTINGNEIKLKFLPFVERKVLSDGQVELRSSDGYFDLNATKSLTLAFNKLSLFKGEDKGRFPLNMCAAENLSFFKLQTDHTFTFERLNSYNQKNTSEIVPNLLAFMTACEKIVNSSSQEQDALDARYKEALKWAEDFGFKDPKTMTFQAEYKDGSEHLLRLTFHTMKEMTLTTFIPRKDVIFSLGLLLYLAITSIPVLIALYFLWRSQKFLRRRYTNTNNDLFAKWYQPCWLKLSHPEDEAINAISASTKAKINMAPSDMLRGIFMLAFSSVMALLLIFNGVKWINWILPKGLADILGFKRELVEELGYAINKAQNVTNGSGSFSGDKLTGWKAELPLTVFFNDDGGLSILALLIVFGLILLGLTLIGRLFEKFALNPALKSGIDGIAQGSTVQGAFGNDVLGEKPTQCQAYPWEFDNPYAGKFPEPVQEAIENYANEDLVHLPGKFREALHKNVSTAHDFSLSDLLEGDMGEILLHTSYFSVKEFQDLFAAVLISRGDVKHSKHFKDYATASKWTANLTNISL